MKGKYLITTDAWFFAPDGRQYRAVWGDVEILSDSVLGVKTNSRSSNWYAKVSGEQEHVILAGCQIHYAVKCDVVTNDEKIIEEDVHDGQVVTNEYLKKIYIPE